MFLDHYVIGKFVFSFKIKTSLSCTLYNDKTYEIQFV